MAEEMDVPETPGPDGGAGLPKMFRVRQRFDQPAVGDVREEVRRQIGRLNLAGRFRPGATVAVTAGSRGVANIAAVVRTVVDALKELGLHPFIIPGMGSHGGATVEGQLKILAGYGITAATMGAPLRATMDVVEVARNPWGLPILVDRYAAEADHIVLVNRVKQHTNFSGEVESGLMKMLVIGLGKARGAKMAHRAAVDLGFERMIPEIARISVSRLPILFGVGLVENARHQTARVAVTLPEDLEATEKELQREAKRLLGKIPFDHLHLLIVDGMGKEISGTGMDPKVIGRIYLPPHEEPKSPRYLRILVRDLTAQTGGNAVGMGLADFATRRLASKVDFKVTYTNSLTGLSPMRSKLPIIFETDREAIEGALSTIGLTEPEDARVVRIRNTLELEEFAASQALEEEVRRNPSLEILGGPEALRFDDAGSLLG